MLTMCDALLAVAILCATWSCGPGYRSKAEMTHDHFAIGKNWPEAITSLEEALGENVSWHASCSTNQGSPLDFGRLSSKEYLLGARVFQDRGAFRQALTGSFARAQCEAAEVTVDEHTVATLQIARGQITQASVSQR